MHKLPVSRESELIMEEKDWENYECSEVGPA